MIKRIIYYGIAGVAIAGSATCSDSGRQEFLSLGTAGTGGIYYPLGGAIAARLSVMDSVRPYTAEVSGGSVENVNRLRERQTDLAFATGNTIYEAATGGQDYEEAVADLRVLAPLYANMTHIVVARGSTAGAIADLAGGTVSVRPPGSGTEQMSRQIDMASLLESPIGLHAVTQAWVDANLAGGGRSR